MFWTKRRKSCSTMSTKQSQKKHRARVHVERMKIIEYVTMGLAILLFLGLGLYYSCHGPIRNRSAEAEPTVSPVPTEDPTVRGMHVFSALDNGAFTVEPDGDTYRVTAQNGVVFTMHMHSDDSGITELSFETPYCADPSEEGAVYDALREENRKTTEALRTLFDGIMPVFHRSIYDSETIVQQCAKVAEKGTSYSKHLTNYSVRILSDPTETPQTVTVSFIRDT